MTIECRHTADQIRSWRRDGGVRIEGFFTPDEVTAVVADFEILFPRAEGQGGALVEAEKTFSGGQFDNMQTVPFNCSPALNLIGAHPALIDLAKDALGVEQVHIYQYQAWAKFTGEADYDQPFHCDFMNHTLMAPSEDSAQNSITIICYFNDVGEGQGPMHYVARPDSAAVAGPEATWNYDKDFQADLQRRLAPFERTTAGPAGTIFPYSIDLYHRGTNLTAPGGRRLAVMTCFKAAGNDKISYTAWAHEFWKPWDVVFEHGTPEQLACFGVPLPGDPFWTETTIARTKARRPGWNPGPYLKALGVKDAA